MYSSFQMGYRGSGGVGWRWKWQFFTLTLETRSGQAGPKRRKRKSCHEVLCWSGCVDQGDRDLHC
jgi:hypothetical protein